MGCRGMRTDDEMKNTCRNCRSDSRMEPIPSTDRQTILLVDDDVNIIAFVSALLVDCGYEILTATSGAMRFNGRRITRAR